MFDPVKIQAMLHTCMMLQNVSHYHSFIYNEDVKDVQNLHGKYWETKEVQISNYQASNDIRIGFDGLKEQYRGIYNGPKCEEIKKFEKVCDHDDIAVVWPLDLVNE
ncbi:unnamed protein product [Diamesa hyperborea]